jgi:hypothetical protein
MNYIAAAKLNITIERGKPTGGRPRVGRTCPGHRRRQSSSPEPRCARFCPGRMRAGPDAPRTHRRASTFTRSARARAGRQPNPADSAALPHMRTAMDQLSFSVDNMFSNPFDTTFGTAPDNVFSNPLDNAEGPP